MRDYVSYLGDLSTASENSDPSVGIGIAIS